jgi:hypothetical protein
MKQPQSKKIIEALGRRGVVVDDQAGRIVVQFRGNVVKRGFRASPDLAESVATADRRRSSAVSLPGVSSRRRSATAVR